MSYLHGFINSIRDLDLILKERRLHWYGQVECSNGAVKIAFDLQVDGKRGPGRPKMTWKQLTERDCKEWKLSAINPHDRHTWRSSMRSAKYAASQLPGRGPTDVDVADDDDDDSGEVQNRFSRWLPWWPSWISNQNDFSYF